MNEPRINQRRVAARWNMSKNQDAPIEKTRKPWRRPKRPAVVGDLSWRARNSGSQAMGASKERSSGGKQMTTRIALSVVRRMAWMGKSDKNFI